MIPDTNHDPRVEALLRENSRLRIRLELASHILREAFMTGHKRHEAWEPFLERKHRELAQHAEEKYL